MEIVLLSLSAGTHIKSCTHIEQPLSACLSEIDPCHQLRDLGSDIDVTFSAPICKGQRVLAQVAVGLICRLSGRLNDT